MKHLSLLIAAFALALGACESHSWEDVKDADGNVTERGTKRLFESHDAHGGGDHGAGQDKDQGGHKPEGDKEKVEQGH